MSTIELDRVTKSYSRDDGSRHLVLDVPRLSVAAGEAVCFVGGSGTGKTTLLNVIAGIVTPDTGTVIVGGADVARMPEGQRDRYRARHVGYVFQVFNLLQGFTALENVLLPMHFAGIDGAEAVGRAEGLLARLNVAHRKTQRPSQLSVGEQQRVALARAVACRPNVLLADEPTANLDPENADEALKLLRDVARESGATLLVVTHDQRVRSAFERVEVLRRLS